MKIIIKLMRLSCFIFAAAMFLMDYVSVVTVGTFAATGAVGIRTAAAIAAIIGHLFASVRTERKPQCEANGIKEAG